MTNSILEQPQSTSFRGFQHDERCRFRSLHTTGVRIVIRLTYRCDMWCPHCLLDRKGGKGELTYQEWAGVLAELKDIDTRKVLLTGGEPLLHRDVVALTRFISSMGIPVDLNSNMQTMTRDLMAQFREAGLTEISVALEGPEAIHDRVRGKAGAFAKTVQAIQWAHELGIQVDAACCLTRDNYRYMTELHAVLSDLPIESFTISRLYPIGHGARVTHQILDQPTLTQTYHELSESLVSSSKIPIRLVGLLGYPAHADCTRGHSLIGLTPQGQLLACVLTDDNPLDISHPLEVGLKAAVSQMRERLSTRAYRICCEVAS